MKKPGKKSSKLVWPLLLATVCWWGCNSSHKIPEAQACREPLIFGSASQSLTPSQKTLLANTLQGALEQQHIVTFAKHEESPSCARITLAVYQRQPQLFQGLLTMEQGNYQLQATAVSETLDQLPDACATRLFYLWGLHYQSTTELLAALQKETGPAGYREDILNELIPRQDPLVIEPLGNLLATTREVSVFTKILGALVATGRPEAAKQIIRGRQHKSPAAIIQLVYALEQLPLEATAGYLETIASGHPDQKVRQAAATVLENKRRFSHAQPQ